MMLHVEIINNSNYGDCSNGAQASCYSCPLGTNKTTSGAGSCDSCPAGYECTDPALEPTPCTAGTYR